MMVDWKNINITKISTLPKAIYKSNVISIKIVGSFFSDLEKKRVLKIIWKHEDPTYLKESFTTKTKLEASQYQISGYPTRQ